MYTFPQSLQVLIFCKLQKAVRIRANWAEALLLIIPRMSRSSSQLDMKPYWSQIMKTLDIFDILLSAVWWSDGQHWAIIEGAVSLIQC